MRGSRHRVGSVCACARRALKRTERTPRTFRGSIFKVVIGLSLTTGLALMKHFLLFSLPAVHTPPNPLPHPLAPPPLSLSFACISCFIADGSLCSHLAWRPNPSPRWIIAQRTAPPTQGRITSSPRGPWCSSLARRLKVRNPPPAKNVGKCRERCTKTRTLNWFRRDHSWGDR